MINTQLLMSAHREQQSLSWRRQGHPDVELQLPSPPDSMPSGEE